MQPNSMIGTFDLNSRQIEVIVNYLKLVNGESVNKNFIAMKAEIEEVIKLLS